jgi:16S rRNA (uracil1498-N3)-methyltransferase
MNTFLFYDPLIDDSSENFSLQADESWHIIKVLRFRTGSTVLITNGAGIIFETELIDDNPKAVKVRLIHHKKHDLPVPSVKLAISPVKNRETMEWLAEKATEIGVSDLYFFTSEHSERTVLNLDRLEKIVVSAIKQSLNPYKPALHPLLTYKSLLYHFENKTCQKLIAHCDLGPEHHISHIYTPQSDVLLLIGPEGGFSEKEVDAAKCTKFDVINLGKNRLRTETASIYALTAIQTLNNL